MRISDWSSDVCSSDLTAVRREVAMTGEVTLRGRVLLIGGLKEKLLAALRAGIKTVLIPQENEKDLADIPDNVKRKMEIVPVSDCDEVLARALVSKLTPIEWTESDDRSAEHTAELQSLMRISYAVYRLKKTKHTIVET